MIEDEAGLLPPAKGRARLPLGACAIETVKLRFNPCRAIPLTQVRGGIPYWGLVLRRP